MGKHIAFSAAQPSGNLTIGNYLGAIRDWVSIQDDYECIYCIADLHAITSIYNRKLYNLTLDTLALFLACGINPDKSIIFIQSHVSEHNQLHWLLNCFANFGELSRMTQFKETFSSCKNSVNVGLFNYPVLMASDILLYQTNYVPVGEDQKQHLEFVRNLAKRFNNYYNNNVFVIPKLYITNYGKKIMSLLNPKKKMSKSDINFNNVVFLLDEPNLIFRKIKKSITDSNKPHIIYYDPIFKPGISNLLNILSIITKKEISELEQEFKNETYNNFKNIVSEELIRVLIPIQSEYYSIRNDITYLNKVMKEGFERAHCKAYVNLNNIYNIVGLVT